MVKKYFIGCLYNNKKVRPLHIIPPKTSAYVKGYDGQAKWMYFLIADDYLLEKYNNIWDKFGAILKKKEFDKEPVYNKEYLKSKIKPRGDEVTGFCNK